MTLGPSLPALVLQKLDALPVQPGVYLFKDKKGGVLYVGKAKSLRSRVRSYFQAGGSDTRFFIPMLPRLLGDLDTVVTGSEKEAAILENNLIKQHRPRFNVKLRDDKEYISLRLLERARWPRLEVVRKPTPDGARYFGPYHSATSARRTLHLVNKHFQLRTCTDQELAGRRRPCLQFQIKRCPAPCVLDVDPTFYAEQVRAVALFLDNRHDELSEELSRRMQEAARELRFELAGIYRDQLAAIEKVREEQRVVAVDDRDRDVLGIHREGELVELALLHVRGGRLADVATYSLKGAEIPDDELVSAFLAQRYGGPLDDEPAADGVGGGEGAPAVLVPDEILLPVEPEALAGIAEWLGERAGRRVRLSRPERGEKVELLRLATDNARHAFQEKQRASDDVHERLAELARILRLPTTPRRIECCDISHLGGRDTVGAVVALLDGAPDKARYRTFHVRGDGGVAPEGEPPAPRPTGAESHLGDDYRAMREVLARRFRRGLGARRRGAAAATAGEASGTPPPAAADEAWDLPDLFVVDGGRGQLGVALAAARDLGLHELPLCALAKEKESVTGEALVDRVYLPGQKNPIPLRTNSAAMYFLARARDEAHRFSNRAREKLGRARRLRSALDDVPGIGPKTKKALLDALGSPARVALADDATLLRVPGVTQRHVRALRASEALTKLAKVGPAAPPTAAAAEPPTDNSGGGGAT